MSTTTYQQVILDRLAVVQYSDDFNFYTVTKHPRGFTKDYLKLVSEYQDIRTRATRRVSQPKTSDFYTNVALFTAPVGFGLATLVLISIIIGLFVLAFSGIDMSMLIGLFAFAAMMAGGATVHTTMSALSEKKDAKAESKTISARREKAAQEGLPYVLHGNEKLRLEVLNTLMGAWWFMVGERFTEAGHGTITTTDASGMDLMEQFRFHQTAQLRHPDLGVITVKAIPDMDNDTFKFKFTI